MTKIIVELCQNHAGKRDVLEQQIKAAAENGADIVKMQSIWSEDLTRRDRFEKGEINPDGTQKTIQRPYAPEVERLSKLDLSLDDHRFFIDTCVKLGVIPMTTIFARNRIPTVGSLPWPGKWVKVASYDCASYPMLRELAQYFDNFIISTGATYDEEIGKTAELMGSLHKDFAFLHCVTSYPNTVEMANLSRMDWLKRFTPHVGWSDHSLVARDGVMLSKVAIMLGAEYIERHFTVLPASDTKDGPVSITPELLRELSVFRSLPKAEQRATVERDIPNWEDMLGTPNREMTQTELMNRDYYRGRFAAKVGSECVYNWEEKPVF
jgi:N,N'-diacetyllegionaminate synthase